MYLQKVVSKLASRRSVMTRAGSGSGSVSQRYGSEDTKIVLREHVHIGDPTEIVSEVAVFCCEAALYEDMYSMPGENSRR